MRYIYGLIFTFTLCFITIFILNNKDKKSKVKSISFEILSHAGTQNTYTEAQNVFKSLKDAGFEPDFLANQQKEAATD